MPRPCMPHASMCELSSLEVTRGSKTRPCMAAGMPQPSSTTEMTRLSPSLDMATKICEA